MDQINILIVEDNELHAEKLDLLLEDLDFCVVGIVDNALDALDLFQKKSPDLILLDISITGSFTGIDFAERIRKTSAVPIVYVSSIRDKETFEKAKATSPDAFLFKPIEEESLVAAIDLALHRSTLTNTTEETSNNQWVEAVFVRVGNSLKKIEINTIVYIEVSAKNYCDIRTQSSRYSVKASLSEILKQLPEHQFIRVSRSHVVNLSFVQSINERESYIETGLEEVGFTKSYKDQLLKQLKLL